MKNSEAIIGAYDVAKRIRDGSLTRTAGIEDLHQRFGMNRSSASGAFTNIAHMLKGEPYKRTMNALETEHFLQMIHRDYGTDGLSKAIASVEKHIRYYEGLPRGSKLLNIWQIVHKYRVVGNGGMESLPDDEADQAGSTDGADYLPSGEDRREIVERQIRERRGQQQFRDALRKRYGDCCLVTGCEVLSVLEAAHISPYRGRDDNHPTNGLLLRADIHTLFDLDLLGIEPEELRVELHPAVVNEYGSLVGEALRCPSNRRPATNALSMRYEQFRQRRRTKRCT